MVNIIEKTAKFTDNKGNEQFAKIRINSGIYISIDTFDQNNNITGYVRIYFHPDKRFYLDAIYCLDEFRRNGIATMISELADYIMSDYEGYIIRGVFYPTQMFSDRRNGIVRSELELDASARNFYKKNGYEVINYEDYLSNPKKYPYINSVDFQLGEERAKNIVAKVIMQKEYPFVESNGIINSVYPKTNIKTLKR